MEALRTIAYNECKEKWMSRLRFLFLGPPKIEIDGIPARFDTRKAIALLAYLCATGEPQSRDSLVALLWSQYGRAPGRSALRRTLSALRGAIDSSWFDTTRELISLRTSAEILIDIDRAKELLAQCDAHEHGPFGICPACIPLLREASELHRGDFLSGFTLKDSLPFDDWQFFITEDFRLKRMTILDRLARGYAASGDYSSAIGVARLRLIQDPLDESAHAALMRLYAWSGNRSAALRQFEECARIVRRELNSAVGSETLQLCDAIRHSQAPHPPSFGTAPLAGEHEKPPESSTCERERALATVLVVSNSRSLPAAELPEEDVRGVIERHNGRVIESSADCLVASFADRRLMESNPELALRAAREAAERGGGLNVSVATGEVWRDAGQPRGSAPARLTGEPARRARQLAKASPAPGVIVDEHTYRLTHGAFSFGPAEGPSRGSVRKNRSYRLLGMRPHARKTRGLGGAPTALVGREDELLRLENAFEKAQGGCGQVVIISGEAGIGKSRLVEELRACIGTLAPGAETRWFEGRCLARTISVSYWPFSDMFAAYSSGREFGAGHCQPLKELLSGLVGRGFLIERESLEIERIITGFLSTSGGRSGRSQDMTPEQVKHATFTGIQTLFHALAKDAPAVFVFEDLHWADDLSLSLIEELVECVKDVRAMLLCVFRPDPGHKSRHLPSVVARRRPADLTEIHLREITPETSERLLDNILPTRSPTGAVRDYILRRSQGNPYFLEELARAVTDGELGFVESGPVAESGAEPAAMSVPEGIKRVVLSRFFSLSPPQQQILQCASVIGRIFSRHMLELVLERTDLVSLLDELEDRELLFVERTVPEVEYSFKHVLAQEAIYEGLGDDARQNLHRCVAKAYAVMTRDDPFEFCEQLALHYDRGNEAAKAISCYYQAGEKARRAYANEAAIFHLTRGLELLREATDIENPQSVELDFLVALGVPLVLTRGHQSNEVETSYLRAQAICERAGTPHQAFQVILGLRRLYFSRGEHRREREYAQQLLDLGQREHDVALISRGHMMLAETLLALGDFPACRAHADNGLSLYDPRSSRVHVVQFGNDTGVGCSICAAGAQWSLGFPDQALRTIESAVSRARELAHPFTLVFALHNAALIAYFRREAEKALRWSREVISISASEGFTLYKGWGPILHGWALGMLGDGKQGTRMIREGMASQPPFMPFMTCFTSMLSEICANQGQVADALAAVNEGLEIARSSDTHLWEPELNRLRGEVGLSAGEPKTDLERWFLRSLRLARKQHARLLELRTLVSLYRLHAGDETAPETRGKIDTLCQCLGEGYETADIRDARLAVAEGAR